MTKMKRIDLGDIELAVLDQGAGVPLLLIHGFPLDHSMWRGQIDGLADDCRVVAPDLRGFGRSNVTEGTVTMAQMADDLAELLDRLGIDGQVVVCGLSMGGYVVFEFFKRHRKLVRGLVLCDTRAMSDAAAVAQGRRVMAAKVIAEGPAALVDMMFPKLFGNETVTSRQAVLAATRAVMMGTDPRGIAAAALGMAEREDMTPLLPEIDCPTLVVVGEEDAISPAEEMRTIAEEIPGARFIEIAQAGHMAPLEQPEAVNAAIRRWLAGL